MNTDVYLFHNWINKLFSKENKVPSTLFEARKLAGSVNYKQVKQYEIVLSFKVSLFFSLFIHEYEESLFI